MNKHTESLKVLASGAAISLLFGIVGYLLMFLFQLFTARHFGPKNLGLFEMSFTFLNMGVLVSLIGIQGGISRYISVYEERGDFSKLNGYLKFIFRIPIIASLIIAALLFFLSQNIASFFNFEPVFTILLKIIALAIPFRVINEIIYQIFFAKNKILIRNIGYNIIEKVVLVVGLFIAIYFGLSIRYIIILLSLSVLFVFIFNLLHLKLKIRFKKSQELTFAYRDWLFFSLPLFFSSMFAFVINWTDNIVIGKIMDSSSLGIYSTSFYLASFLIFFQTSFFAIFVPVVSRLYAKKDDAELANVYKKAQNWVFGLALPFALLFIFFAKNILINLYGVSFSEGAIPLIILSLGLLFNVYTGLNPALLRIVKKTNFIFKTKIIAAGLNVILSIVLVKSLGIVGAAISTSVVISLEQLIYMLKVRSYLKIRHNNFINTKLIISGLMLIVFVKYMVGYFFGAGINIYWLVIISMLYLISYFSIIFFAKIFDKKDYLIFKQPSKNGG
ncbi:polysaccharide biosynthesis protein [bacterium BMS3Abin15]|nr:polysaccharide biosynthesis protein [bacterium BMS3Abin15]